MDQASQSSEGRLQAGRAEAAHAAHELRAASSNSVLTVEDEAVRHKQGFLEVEATLPTKLGGHADDTPILDRLLAFVLRDKNPMAKEVNPDDDMVWLFDNTAYQRDGAGAAHWHAEFVAAYFARHTGRDLSAAVANIADKIGVDDDHLGATGDAKRRIEERLKSFALGIRPARLVNVAFANEYVKQLGPSGSDGISSQIIEQLGHRTEGEALESSPTMSELHFPSPMSTYFVGPAGWMIISDIDDSIKVTMTSSPIGVLQSTFYDEPTPIAGMPDLYRYIHERLSPNWFYLSASPYALYTFLRPWLRKVYPHGTLILRDASLQDLNGLLRSLTVGTKAYKSSRIEKIHSWFPRRRVICVGDSTQSDPEAYGEMCRKFPGWIQAVFIRKVVGVVGMDATEKNVPERFEKAFIGVPSDIWKVFDDPQELYAAVDALDKKR